MQRVQAKTPNEQVLATMAATAQGRASAIINDDDAVLGSCVSVGFGVVVGQGSTSASGKSKGKGGLGGKAKAKAQQPRQSKSTCPVAAAITARRLSLKTYNNVVALLARAVEVANATIHQVGLYSILF